MELINAQKEDLPCGVICVSGEEKPSIRFINNEMRSFMAVPDGESKWVKYVRENMLLALPIDERNRFIDYIERALSDGAPFKIRHRILDAGGNEVALTGWMQGMMVDGEKEVRIVYAPPGYVEEELTRHEKVYRDTLKKYYDVIFDVDLGTRVVDCMFSKSVKHYGVMPIVRYTYDGAFDYLIDSYIYEEDRERVMDFRKKVFDTVKSFDADVKSIRFRVKHRDYPVIMMDCDVLGTDETRCLVCFKDVTEEDPPFGVKTGEMADGKKVVIRTGGTFDVFVDGHPIAFRNEKSKELLKIMVDKRGGYVGAVHAIKLLWPGEESTKTVQSRYRQTALRLNNTLKEYGVDDIIENRAGQRRIVTEKVLIES